MEVTLKYFTDATRSQGSAGFLSDEVVEGEVGGDGEEGDEEQACVGIVQVNLIPNSTGLVICFIPLKETLLNRKRTKPMTITCMMASDLGHW